MGDKRTRILLLEDDPDDAFLLRDLLDEVAPDQFEIDHVERLAAAVQRIGEARPDVALCDLSVPGSQGLDTFIAVRDAAAGIPIVVLTGLDDETIAVKAVQEGAQDYLVKARLKGDLLVRSLRYAIVRQQVSDYRAVLLERERFDTAISQMSDGIVVADGAWRITAANRAGCLLLNMTESACVGGALDEILAAFELSPALDNLRTSQQRTESFEIARTHTQPPLFIDARLTRLFDAGGQPVSLVLTLRDITEERHNREVRASFFMLISHKLRTPLTVLMACLDLCRRLPPEQAAQEFGEILGICGSEVRRLNEIVDRLLDFKAVASQDLEREASRADTAAVLDGVADLVRSRHPTTPIELASDIPVSAACVECGPEQLAFILEKLLDNAVKFADKAPVEVAVTARSAEAGWVEIAVADNGPGIPHEYHDRIFEEFVQVEDLPTGQVPGLGVGLAMTRHVVQAYGGSIAVESTLGEGSTFRVRLPGC